jgi:hypothetical protein
MADLEDVIRSGRNRIETTGLFRYHRILPTRRGHPLSFQLTKHASHYTQIYPWTINRVHLLRNKENQTGKPSRLRTKLKEESA